MTAIMKIELKDDFIVLPHPTSMQSETPSVPGSPLTATMSMASPSRTMSFGGASFASTLPSSTTSARSSFDLEQTSSAPISLSPGTTLLKGNLVLTLSKPTKVTSLAISLNGSTHIAFLGPGKRAHSSRHFFRTQQFLIEPRANSEVYTQLPKDTISYPFAIELPNSLPSSVSTPHGGTVYRMTAVLTIAKSSSIMSFLSNGITVVTSASVQLYRAPRIFATETDGDEQELECGVEFAGVDGVTETDHPETVDANEHEIVPATIKHTWAGQVEATVAIPFTRLPPRAKPDLHIRVRVMRGGLNIKSMQAALWERAIFRVQKAGSPPGSKKYIMGVRERAVCAQRCDSGWQNEAITGQVPHTFEKIVIFSIPAAARTYKELYSSRSCNPSTYSNLANRMKNERFYHYNPQRGQHSKKEMEIDDSEFGEISVEIQHFIRYSLFVTGSVDQTGKTVPTPVERVLGSVPVIVLGVPSGPQCDLTGLPTYLYSFSTSRVSFEEALDYELEAAAAVGAGGNEFGEDFDGSRVGPLYGAYEDDDAFMSMMGLRGSRTPPSYEDTIGRPSLDASVLEMQEHRLLGSSSSRTADNSGVPPYSVLGLTR
ncbi:hypothetical protein EC957_002653 [Mortierella hygrophila]|uniref:Arrestin-like N-terminal domain-containing protein n=1 Tax=Mortierella hygrophila TaxID=979708 RepID=A0A9P6K1E7_9FUNG|nr:hypothetical protein EC957_002653 [Mortierella hygrophila]